MSNIMVIQAVYGALEGSIDVTSTVQSMVNAGKLSFSASNATFGDPAVGFDKHFGVAYRVGEVEYTVACHEDQTVTLNPNPPIPPFAVKRAVFGALEGSVDVTAAVRKLVFSGQTSFAINTKVLGDPADGFDKHFTMTYTNKGVEQVIACHEGQTVNLKK